MKLAKYLTPSNILAAIAVLGLFCYVVFFNPSSENVR